MGNGLTRGNTLVGQNASILEIRVVMLWQLKLHDVSLHSCKLHVAPRI